MESEKAFTISESEAIRLVAGLNWLFGFVNGTGSNVPMPLFDRFRPLIEFAEMHPTVTPRNGGHGDEQ